MSAPESPGSEELHTAATWRPHQQQTRVQARQQQSTTSQRNTKPQLLHTRPTLKTAAGGHIGDTNRSQPSNLERGHTKRNQPGGKAKYKDLDSRKNEDSRTTTTLWASYLFTIWVLLSTIVLWVYPHHTTLSTKKPPPTSSSLNYHSTESPPYTIRCHHRTLLFRICTLTQCIYYAPTSTTLLCAHTHHNANPATPITYISSHSPSITIKFTLNYHSTLHHLAPTTTRHQWPPPRLLGAPSNIQAPSPPTHHHTAHTKVSNKNCTYQTPKYTKTHHKTKITLSTNLPPIANCRSSALLCSPQQPYPTRPTNHHKLSPRTSNPNGPGASALTPINSPHTPDKPRSLLLCNSRHRTSNLNNNPRTKSPAALSNAHPTPINSSHTPNKTGSLLLCYSRHRTSTPDKNPRARSSTTLPTTHPRTKCDISNSLRPTHLPPLPTHPLEHNQPPTKNRRLHKPKPAKQQQIFLLLTHLHNLPSPSYHFTCTTQICHQQLQIPQHITHPHTSLLSDHATHSHISPLNTHSQIFSSSAHLQFFPSSPHTAHLHNSSLSPHTTLSHISLLSNLKRTRMASTNEASGIQAQMPKTEPGSLYAVRVSLLATPNPTVGAPPVLAERMANVVV